MKTIEELAKELYPDVSFKEDVASEDTFRTNEIRRIQRVAFWKGYNEAMRWRYPEDELPDEGVDVFVKVERSGDCGVEILYTSSAIVNDFYHSKDDNPFGCEGYLPSGNGGRVRVTVLGWRQIE